MTIEIQCKLLTPEAIVPTKSHEDDAGWDLYASCDTRIPEGVQSMVSTGIAIAIPSGYYGQIQSRSGLTVQAETSHRAGVIDAGYRAELRVVLRNESKTHPLVIHKGIRIAQLVIHKVPPIVFTVVGSLPAADRGENGFGSTGS